MDRDALALRLEELIDATSLADLLWALESVCFAKAEHLRSNWQDERAARTWEADAKRIAKAATGIHN